MPVQMLREVPQDKIRITDGIAGPGQALVETLDGTTDSIGSFLGSISNPRAPALFEGIKGLELALRFSLYGFDLIFVFEKGFEFLFLSERCAHGFGFLEGEAALANRGIAVQRDGCACYWIRDLGETRRCAGWPGDAHGQLQRVNGFRGWIQQEVGDVQGALFVFEDG